MLFRRRPSPAAAAIALAAAVVLSGCQPPRPAPKDPAAEEAAALEAKGYTHAPVVTAIAPGDPGFVAIAGNAPADSRVRFSFSDPLKGGAQAVGVTADGEGHFHAEVPITANGGLYDITVDDGGRVRQAEGRLFVPPGRPGRAVMIRSGAPSLPVFTGGGALAAIDFDGNGAFAVSGHVRPMAPVDVALDGQVLARAQADATGLYTLLIQINKLPPDEVLNIAVISGGATAKQDTTLSAPADGPGDHISPAGKGWRVDWTPQDGRIQSTIVF